ncbi:MAG: hypothetical protein COB40_08940 [Marinosulfonomonas sp.]|nr:MAG: hypothetical protein COB40_08940 [Marinosulfonomonas sp.]
MAAEKQDSKTLLLMGLLALWLAVYGYSIIYYLTTGDKTAATLPGLSRVAGFMGWQGVAGMIAFACWGIGWGFPKGSGVRRISAVPLGMALALVLALLGLAVFGG